MGSMKDAIQQAYQKGYRVTEDGKLIGLKGNELLVQKRGKQRYPTFSISFKGTNSGVYGVPTHKFAAFCFYGDVIFDEGVIVRHLNSNTNDVSKENIVLGSYSDNENDKLKETRIRTAKTARAAQGRRPVNAKLSDEQIREIRIRAKDEIPKRFCKEYGVSDTTIYEILKGRKYNDVT